MMWWIRVGESAGFEPYAFVMCGLGKRTWPYAYVVVSYTYGSAVADFTAF